MYICEQDDFLAHHGVKGMKWGVRKDRGSSGGGRGSKKSSSNKSMSDEEAAKSAKRKKAIKYVAAIAGVTAASYLGYKMGKRLGREYLDQTFRAGTTLHTLTRDPDFNPSRFYSATGERDRAIYRGEFAKRMANGSGDTGVYDVSRRVKEKLKVPSRNHAAKAFADLYESDSDFRSVVDTRMRERRDKMKNYDTDISLPGARHKLLFDRTSEGMNRRTLMRDGYDAFNVMLGEHEGNITQAHQKFYDRLKSMGYNALQDVNNAGGYKGRRYSDYASSNNSLIVFDMNSVVREGVEKLARESIDVNRSNQLQKQLDNGAKYAAGLGLGVSVAGVAIKEKRDQKKQQQIEDEEKRKKE